MENSLDFDQLEVDPGESAASATQSLIPVRKNDGENGTEASAGPAVQPPEPEQRVFAPTSFAHLPPAILEKIFKDVPVKARIRCSGVCPSWRDELTRSSNWDDIQLGRNINCLPSPPACHAAEFFLLKRVKEVVYRTAVPLFMRQLSAYPDNQNLIPLERLGLLLNRGVELRALDLSAMRVEPGKEADFRALWSDCVDGSFLTNLQLPKGFYASGSWLKKIASRHQNLGHLALSTPVPSHGSQLRITLDSRKNPLNGFTSLTSLSLRFGRDYRAPDVHYFHVQSIGADLNGLQLESLELSASDESPWYKILNHVTTPDLMRTLVSLHMFCLVRMECLEHLSLHCLSLETLRLNRLRLEPEDDAAEPSIPAWPNLRSATLRVEYYCDWDMIRAIHVKMLKIVRSSPRLSDLDLSYNTTQPILPKLADFSNLPDPLLWAKTSSVSFSLRSQEDLRCLRSMSKHFEKLKNLQLWIDNRGAAFPDVPANEPSYRSSVRQDLPAIDSLDCRFSSDICTSSGLTLTNEILSTWGRVKRLYFGIWAAPNIPDATFPLDPSVISDLRLEELKLQWYLEYGKEVPIYAWISKANLRNLKVLILDCGFRLEAGSFAKIVADTPNLEVFRGFEASRRGFVDWIELGVTKLLLADLQAIKNWKKLRRCHLAIDITDKDARISSDCGGEPRFSRKLTYYCPATQKTYDHNRNDRPSWDFLTKFVRLNDVTIIPRLVEDWRKHLGSLDEIDIACRVRIGNVYLKTYPRTGSDIIFPLIYGSMCDCGTLHFLTNTEDASTKRLEFRKLDD